MPDLTQIAQVVAAGLTNGSIYALVALGFSLVFAVGGFLNLAQGEFVIIGGLITIALFEGLGVPLPLAAAAAVVIAVVLGVVLQQLTLSPERQLSPDAALIVTLGAAFVARGGAMIVFGKDPQALSSFSGERPLHVGGVAIATQSLWIAGTLVAASAALWLFFKKTYAGKAMMACAQSPTGARLVGINLRHIALLSFATSAGLGALAGIVVAPLTFVSFDDGLAIAIKGFIAAVIGGLGSFPGAVAGGLFLGLVENLGAAFISSQYKDALAFLGLLLLLLFRPGGLFGAARR